MRKQIKADNIDSYFSQFDHRKVRFSGLVHHKIKTG